MDRYMFTIKAEWDAEAKVWYVAESDVPGLVAWGDTFDELVGDVLCLIPDLLELNAHLLDKPVHGHVPITLLAAQHTAVHAP